MHVLISKVHCALCFSIVCTTRRECRDSRCEETGGCGKKCVYCPLLLHFVFLTTGLQLPEYFNQLSWIDCLMENAKIKSEAHIRALRCSMVSSLTHRGICRREVDWKWIVLWLMLDGKWEVGCTPTFLFLLCPFISKNPIHFIPWNWCVWANCALHSLQYPCLPSSFPLQVWLPTHP